MLRSSAKRLNALHLKFIDKLIYAVCVCECDRREDELRLLSCSSPMKVVAFLDFRRANFLDHILPLRLYIASEIGRAHV